MIGSPACTAGEPRDILRKRDGNQLESLSHRRIDMDHLDEIIGTGSKAQHHRRFMDDFASIDTTHGHPHWQYNRRLTEQQRRYTDSSFSHFPFAPHYLQSTSWRLGYLKLALCERVKDGVVVIVYLQEDDSFVDGIVIGTKRDLSADTLQRMANTEAPYRMLNVFSPNTFHSTRQQCFNLLLVTILLV